MANFLTETIKNFQATGSVIPSSRKLTKQILKEADIKNRKVIVEFGPGTGVFTKKILKEKSPEALYFAIELNEEFALLTQKKCKDAIVYNDTATNLAKYLEKHNVKECDCIISGLPFANFCDGLQEDILQAVKDNLSNDGVFVTFAYNVGLLRKAGKSFRKKLPKFFGHVKRSKTIWNNVPPAFIYNVKK